MGYRRREGWYVVKRFVSNQDRVVARMVIETHQKNRDDLPGLYPVRLDHTSLEANKVRLSATKIYKPTKGK